MFPKVQKGQRFQPSASMHNAVVDMLNSANGMLAGEQKSGNQNMVRISIVNRTGEVLPSGAPVAIDGISGKNMIFSVRKVKKEDVIVAVVQNTLQENAVGSAILCGVCAVSAKGNEERFVFPKPDSFEWEYRKNGGFPVLCKKGSTVFILTVYGKADETPSETGGGHDLFRATYDAEKKKIRVTGGYSNCNGDWFGPGKATELAPQDGIICLIAKPDEAHGRYSEPTIGYAEPSASNIPLAKISVEKITFTNEDGKTETELRPSIMNYGVSTAGVVETARCPLASAGGGV